MTPNKFLRNIALMVILFVGLVGLIYFGLGLLKRYTSEAYVLSHSIQNIVDESALSAKLRYALASHESYLRDLDAHIIRKEDDVPHLASEIESYADALGVSLTINSIAIGEPVKAKGAKSAAKPQPDAGAAGKTRINPLYMEITAMGDFGRLVKFISLLEHSNYSIRFDTYSLKQMGLLESRTPGVLTPVEIREENRLQIKRITWVLTGRIIADTYIKQ